MQKAQRRFDCQWAAAYAQHKCPSTWPMHIITRRHFWKKKTKPKEKKKLVSSVLTADDKICSWSSQQFRAAGQWADKSADPAEHQEDETERQHDDHHLVQAYQHTIITIHLFIGYVMQVKIQK